MADKYFARYSSPNIVIVPTETKNKNLYGTTNITGNCVSSTIKQFDSKYSDVLSKTFNKSLVNNSLDLNMSTNCRDIDSVEEALRQVSIFIERMLFLLESLIIHTYLLLSYTLLILNTGNDFDLVSDVVF